MPSHYFCTEHSVVKITTPSKGPITWRISAGTNFGPPTGLKFSCDYMANFAIGWESSQERKRFTFTTRAVSMPKFIFQTGLKFECDYMRFFSPFDWAESSSLVSQSGLKLSSRNRKRLFKIHPGSRAEISARLAGLKFVM